MPKAYSYIRFSTPEQAQGDSLRRQMKLAQDYAARHALDLDLNLTFQDQGVSAYRGRNARAGKLAAFLEAVEVGLVENGSVLLVESLDRISRRAARHAAMVLNQIVDAGITVVTLDDEKVYSSESLDNDPISFLFVVIGFLRANEESSIKARRVGAAWEAKRNNASQKPITSRGPGWLRFENGSFHEVEDRGDVVRRIFNEALMGRGLAAIAAGLNEGGVPVFGNGKRKAKYWHRTYLAKILSNPAVVGTFIPHKIEYEGDRRVRVPQTPIPNYFPHVVDEATFQDVQAIRRAKAPRRGRHASSEVRNLFGGLLKCGVCGQTVTRVSKGQGREYLVCTAAKAGLGCEYKSVRYGTVESLFIEQSSWVLEAPPAGHGDKEVDIQISHAETSRAALEDGIENILVSLQEAPSHTLAARLGVLETEKQELEKDLKDLYTRRDEVSGVLVGRRVENLAKVLASQPLDRTEAHPLMQLVFSDIILDMESGVLRLSWRHGGESEVLVMWPLNSDRGKCK